METSSSVNYENRRSSCTCFAVDRTDNKVCDLLIEFSKPAPKVLKVEALGSFLKLHTLCGHKLVFDCERVRQKFMDIFERFSHAFSEKVLTLIDRLLKFRLSDFPPTPRVLQNPPKDYLNYFSRKIFIFYNEEENQ